MTSAVVNPRCDQINAVLKVGAPQNKNHVCSFFCGVTFYKSMVPRRSHVLKALTELTGKGFFFIGTTSISKLSI